MSRLGLFRFRRKLPIPGRRGIFARSLQVAWKAGVAIVLVTAIPVVALRWIEPPTTAYMLQSDSAVSYRWVDLERISPYAALAVIAAEDQKFALHGGFDVESIRDAVAERRRGGRLRGASTISQQVAKNLFLWPGKSFVRKGLEAYFTVLIELLWPKTRILEVYLNVAEFGNGVFGVAAAAETYFGKPPDRIAREEAALLAAVLPNPLLFRVDLPSRYVGERRDWILGQMSDLGDLAYLRVLD